MDQATATIDHILKSGDYVEIKDVPVFDEHDEFDDEGNLVRRFGRAELQELADNSNAKAGAGDLSPIGPGHTIPHAPETHQPPIWGYAGQYRVGTFGPKQKLGILCNFYVRKTVQENGQTVDGPAAVLSYPRRSPEIWLKRKDIDWIALLRKAPERNLGLLTYSRGELKPAAAVRFFSDPARATPSAAIVSGGKLRYSMEANMPFEPDQLDATAAPNAMLDPEERDRVLAYIREAFPSLDAMHDESKARYEAEAAAMPANGEALDQDGATGPGATGPTNGYLPGSETVESSDEDEDEEEEPIRMSRETATAEPAEITIKKLEARLAALEKEKAEEAKRYARASAEKYVQRLEYDGIVLDRKAEIENLAALPDDKARKDRADYIARYHRRDSASFIPAGGLVDFGPAAEAVPAVADYDTCNRAKNLATTKGISFDDALAQVRGN